MPPDAEAQVANIFKQIKLCVEAAGGTVDDIIKVNFWIKDPAIGRKMLNGEWTEDVSRRRRRGRPVTRWRSAPTTPTTSPAISSAVIGG